MFEQFLPSIFGAALSGIMGDDAPSGGSTGNQAVQQESQPWQPTQEHLLRFLSEANNWYDNVQTPFYPDQTVADTSPWTHAGQGYGLQSALDRAGLGGLLQQMGVQGLQQFQDSANRGNTALDQAVATYTNPGNSEAVKAMRAALGQLYDAEANTTLRNTSQKLWEQTLPQIDMQAIMDDVYGSGRDTATRVQATRNADQNMQDVLARTQGEHQKVLAGLLDQTQQNALRAIVQERANTGNPMDILRQGTTWAADPAQAMLGIGAYDEAQLQRLLNADLERYNYGRDQPLQRLQSFGNMVLPVAQRGSITYGPEYASNPLQRMVGGALAGNNLWNQISRSMQPTQVAGTPEVMTRGYQNTYTADGPFDYNTYDRQIWD